MKFAILPVVSVNTDTAACIQSWHCCIFTVSLLFLLLEWTDIRRRTY